MGAIDPELLRISKLLIDRNATSAEAALAWRQAYSVTLCCGDDVAGSYTLQLAALTAARIAARCFPGAVRLSLSPALAEGPLRIWPWLHRTFGEALVEILGPAALIDSGASASRDPWYSGTRLRPAARCASPSTDGSQRSAPHRGWRA